jgi:hypothetical protein
MRDAIYAALLTLLVLYACTQDPINLTDGAACMTDSECSLFCPVDDPDCDGGPEADHA